jgi:hypothetical protein
LSFHDEAPCDVSRQCDNSSSKGDGSGAILTADVPNYLLTHHAVSLMPFYNYFNISEQIGHQFFSAMVKHDKFIQLIHKNYLKANAIPDSI